MSKELVQNYTVLERYARNLRNNQVCPFQVTKSLSLSCQLHIPRGTGLLRDHHYPASPTLNYVYRDELHHIVSPNNSNCSWLLKGLASALSSTGTHCELIFFYDFCLGGWLPQNEALECCVFLVRSEHRKGCDSSSPGDVWPTAREELFLSRLSWSECLWVCHHITGDVCILVFWRVFFCMHTLRLICMLGFDVGKYIHVYVKEFF